MPEGVGGEVVLADEVENYFRGGCEEEQEEEVADEVFDQKQHLFY